MKFNLRKIKFFYINLNSRLDRNMRMEYMLTDAGVNYERFEAIVPTFDEINNGKYKFLKSRLSGRCLYKNKTALAVCGIYLSHYSILCKMKEHKQPFVILEDDVANITKKTLKNLNRILNKNRNLFSNNEWDLIRPFSSVFNKNFITKIDAINNVKRFPCDYLNMLSNDIANFNGNEHGFNGGAHFCIINNANSIKNFLDNQSVSDIDHLYSTNKINSYLLNFKKIYQDDRCGSDVPIFDVN